MSLLFGWLLDVDHFIDYSYFLFQKNKLPDLNEFLSGNYFLENKKIFIFFHSYEISLVLFIIAFFNNDYLYYIALSHLFHLLQDQKTNNVMVLSYFFTNRFLKKFNVDAVCK